jgi:hypothetical protein
MQPVGSFPTAFTGLSPKTVAIIAHNHSVRSVRVDHVQMAYDFSCIFDWSFLGELNRCNSPVHSINGSLTGYLFATATKTCRWGRSLQLALQQRPIQIHRLSTMPLVDNDHVDAPRDEG